MKAEFDWKNRKLNSRMVEFMKFGDGKLKENV